VAAVRALQFAAIRGKRRFGSEEVVEQAGVLYVGVFEVRFAIYALKHPGSHIGTHSERTSTERVTDVPGKAYFRSRNQSMVVRPQRAGSPPKDAKKGAHLRRRPLHGIANKTDEARR
jgi:hypothetical protein